MEAGLSQLGQSCAHQLASDSRAPMVGRHMEGRNLSGRPWLGVTFGAQAREPNEFRVSFGYQGALPGPVCALQDRFPSAQPLDRVDAIQRWLRQHAPVCRSP